MSIELPLSALVPEMSPDPVSCESPTQSQLLVLCWRCKSRFLTAGKCSWLDPLAVQVGIAHLVHDYQTGEDGAQHSQVPGTTSDSGSEPQ